MVVPLPYIGKLAYNVAGINGKIWGPPCKKTSLMEVLLTHLASHWLHPTAELAQLRGGPPTISESQGHSSGVAVAAEVEQAGAAALGAHVGALGHHEVHEARAAPGCHEDVPRGGGVVSGAGAGAAVVEGGGLVGRREGRERGRDGGAPAAAGAAALGLLLLVVFLVLVVVVVAAVVVGAGAWPGGDVRADGRHGGVAGRGAADAACARRAARDGRRRARRRRGMEGRRARVDGRAGAVLPVDVVHLPRLHKSAQMYIDTYKDLSYELFV
uniref:Uncharacterized protein n=1 Tax=Arundo donax TaxID=35708 RepID=A0A0A9D5X9_ARUDO